MSLFAGKMMPGMPTRSDVDVVSMPFSGTKPKPGDVVKLTADGKVEVTTTDSDRAYGVVAVYDNKNVCAVVTKGHVLTNLTNPTVGTMAHVSLAVVRKMDAVDAQGALSQNAYEVKVG